MPRASTKSLTAQPKPVDEKITINLGCVDLGQIDLLVQEGFYANRTDLIRTAIRNQLATHGDAVRQVVARKTLSRWVVGRLSETVLLVQPDEADVVIEELRRMGHTPRVVR